MARVLSIFGKKDQDKKDRELEAIREARKGTDEAQRNTDDALSEERAQREEDKQESKRFIQEQHNRLLELEIELTQRQPYRRRPS